MKSDAKERKITKYISHAKENLYIFFSLLIFTVAWLHTYGLGLEISIYTSLEVTHGKHA